jgi:hypothetical protein
MLLLSLIFSFAFLWFLLGFVAAIMLNAFLKRSPLDTELWRGK